jgi:hypothetical protein
VGFLRRLFGNGATDAAASGRTSYEATLYPGDDTLEVVGESHRQEVLWQLVGGRRREDVRHPTHALLLPEPDNPVDPDAISVLIEGQLVGYLSRSVAAAYRPGLVALMERSSNGLVALEAVIVGGGERSDGVGFLGVFLEHDPADFGMTPRRAAQAERGFRTGFSEAVATDLEDDSYDLSWFMELGDDDTKAITRLRRLLETDPDPIDRHYMMCELERRLYRSRDAFASALDEFDALCRQHDGEMDTIRVALMQKFGRVPVIDTYRQATIRCQKAKDWSAAKTWAERGISIYGVDASRSDARQDLEKRLAYALAKLEVANKPRAPRPKRSVAAHATAAATEIEALVCAVCGRSFERVRTRGRKPHACPTCRSGS